MPIYPKKSKKQGLHKRTLWFLLAGLLIVGTLVVLEATNTTHFFHHQIVIHPTANQNTKGEPTNQPNKPSDTNTTTSNGSQAGDDKNNGPTGTTAVLLAPAGDFVSNHRPSLSGAADQKTISSVCTTTAGASCVINFTKGDVTKSLASETTDRGGSAYWTWNVGDYLGVGTWNVTAVATLNGQTKSASDALDMVVSP